MGREDTRFGERAATNEPPESPAASGESTYRYDVSKATTRWPCTVRTGWNQQRTIPRRPINLKRRQDDARDVLLLRLDLKRRGLDLLLHEVGDVARGVGDLCEGEGGELHHAAHLAFGLGWGWGGGGGRGIRIGGGECW
jgi:hypothetical protein